MPNKLTLYFPFLLAGLLVFADQLTKNWVRENIPYLSSIAPIPAIGDYFTFTHTINTGMAFGMFQGGNTFFLIVAIIVSLIIIGYNFMLPPGQLAVRLALGLQLGGAIGNMIDRAFPHAPTGIPGVTDFLHVRGFMLGNLRIPDAPIFNIADFSITAGVIVLGLVLIAETLRERRDAKAAKNTPTQPLQYYAPPAYYPPSPPSPQVVRYQTEDAPVQTLLRRGFEGLIAGVIIGLFLGRQHLGGLLGLIAGLVVAVFQLPRSK